MQLLEIDLECKDWAEAGSQCQWLLQDIAAWTIAEQAAMQLLPVMSPTRAASRRE